MNKSLDFPSSEFKQILDKATDIILGKYDLVDEQKGYNNYAQDEVARWFDEPLPFEGGDVIKLLDEVKQKVIDPATGNMGPNMYAYVMTGGNQISTIADLIATTINQNVAKWHLAPSMTEIEKRVVKWTTEMINYTNDAGGAMVSGGSEANLASLTVARNVFFRNNNVNKNGLFGMKPFLIYCSKETHNCIDKSVGLLGIGTNNMRRIETNRDFTINIAKLEEQIKSDVINGFTPFCIIGNAGSVNTGAIDDLDSLSEISKKYNVWFHVDGAYGGLASSLPSLKHQYKGIEKADSVALDFHKWLYQPFEIGCFLVKNWALLKETYFNKADYLDSDINVISPRLEINEHYFQLSRNAKAFKIWMSIKAYGFALFQQMMQKDIALSAYLSKVIKESDDFEIKSDSDLAIVCFRYIGTFTTEEEIININKKLIPALELDGSIFITGTKLNGEFVIRACLINHRKQKESIHHLLDTIRHVAKTLKGTLN
ncbi:MAG: aminotransferase class I/II-fold pyridoxal phosphate-dependent enzyme [Saprospiraceae bacterium]|nr:aminotransferase class I/II-fold pyridoxal phosphate-dependent enzyme [Saprospiraceae bacterium]